MSWNIVCHVGTEGVNSGRGIPSERLLPVYYGVPDKPDPLQPVIDRLAEFGIFPSIPVLEFLQAVVAAYIGDVRIPRKGSYDGWTRDLSLHLAVQDAASWEAGSALLEQLLAFLTGDHWRVFIREVAEPYSPRPRQRRTVRARLEADAACLFSGGLDSFVGALDLLASGARIALVGHHSAGNGATSTSQARAYDALITEYSETQAPFLRLWVSPPRGAYRGSEITTRGRSILFLGLGIAVAECLATPRLVVPENGLISLNVPLTAARMGSFSTRTTHPHLISLMRQLVGVLGLNTMIELPFRFATKGEMLKQCRRPDLLNAALEATMSCSHPSVGRWSASGNANQHCGYCVPCLIRRASAQASISHDPTLYTVRDLTEPLTTTRGADLRAFRMALDRYAKCPPRLADLLTAGPLPGTDAELAEYLGMFKRGIAEVGSLLRPPGT